MLRVIAYTLDGNRSVITYDSGGELPSKEILTEIVTGKLFDPQYDGRVLIERVDEQNFAPDIQGRDVTGAVK